MNIKVRVIIESENNDKLITEEISCLHRGDLIPESLGITLNESKELLSKIQQAVVAGQVAEYITEHKHCPVCNDEYHNKGMHEISFKTLFGKLRLSSPRFYDCSCHVRTVKSFSPLAECLPERTSPELLYLQTKWSSSCLMV